MYSGYPTMTRQQCEYSQFRQILIFYLSIFNYTFSYTDQQQQQLHQLQQQHAAAAAQHHQQLMQSQQQQSTYGTLQARTAQQATYGTTTTTGSAQAQGLLNSSAYGHYQTLTPKSSGSVGGGVSPGPGQTPPVPQNAPPAYGHHPKCYYYSQQTPLSASTPATNSNSAKLHPVHRYTPGG